jgi:hypothetical protein
VCIHGICVCCYGFTSSFKDVPNSLGSQAQESAREIAAAPRRVVRSSQAGPRRTFLLSTDHSPSELPTPHSTSTLSPTAPLDPIDRVSHIYSPLLTAVVCLGSSLRHVLTFCGQVRHWHLSAVGGPAGWNGCVQKRMAAICHCSDRRPDRCGPL